MNELKVNRSDVLELFDAIGFEGTSRWNAKRITSKLKTLPAYYESYENEELDVELSGEQETLLQNIVEAIEEDVDVEVVAESKSNGKEADADESKPKKETKSKKGKAQQKSKDEEEDEEKGEEDEDVEASPKNTTKPKKGTSSKGAGKKSTTKKLKVGDFVHVANPEEGSKEDEWDGELTEVNDDYVLVKDSNDEEWEEPLAVVSKVRKPPAKSKKKGSAKVKDDKSKGKKKKKGVIAKIEELVSAATEKNQITKQEIVQKLIEEFPDRPGDSLKGTVNVQVPGRISRERGINVIKGQKGYYTA